MEQGEKQDAIIQAALELVAEHGFHGAPMALVARRAGVAAGTIYCYFENKDVMIREIYASLELQAWEVIRDGYPDAGSVCERYMHICRKLIGFFLASPMKFKFVEQFHNSPYGVDCRREKFFVRKDKDLVTQLFEEGQEQGIIKELPLPILSALTFGPLVDAIRDHILNFFNLDGRLIEQVIEACWDAVRR